MSVYPFTLRDDKLNFENSIANETAVVVLKGAVNPTWKTNAERYSTWGNPVSIFDSSAHTTVYGKFYDKKKL